jgi:hypothetical protein
MSNNVEILRAGKNNWKGDPKKHTIKEVKNEYRKKV